MKSKAYLILILFVCANFLIWGNSAEDSFQKLPLNKPQKGSLQQEAQQFFKIDPLEQKLSRDTALSITLNPLTGDPDIYISFAESISTTVYNLKSTNNGADYVLLDYENELYNYSKPVYVLVNAFTETEFYITAHLSNDSVKLDTGEPHLGVLPGRIFSQYVYDHDDGAFNVIVTDLKGDPDIYVSTQGPPNTDSYQWRAKEWGGDILTINPTDKHYGRNTKFYIGIHCFSEQCIHTISIKKKDTIMSLMDRVPADDMLTKSSFSYFKFKLGFEQSLFIDVKEIGEERTDPDVYISTQEKYPSLEHNLWHSSEVGEDIIKISPDDEHYKEGWYYIAVDGFNSGKFTISAFSSPSAKKLSNGQSYNTDVAEGQYKYFYFRNDDSQENIQFSSKTLLGTIELFESPTNTRPQNEPGKYELNSRKDIEEKAPTVEGVYFIGVLGKEKKNNFTLTIIANQTIHELEPLKGSPREFYVPKRRYRHFLFDASGYSDKDLIFTASPVASSKGDIDVYVSQKVRYPTITDFQWQSILGGPGDADSVVIESSDSKRDDSSLYYIAVHGFTSARFKMAAMLSNSSIPLSEKQQYHGKIFKGQKIFFEFDMERFGSLKVDLRPEEDNTPLQLFVSNMNSRPTDYDHQWKSIGTNPNILIDDALSGKYYIGILSNFKSTNFILTAYTESTYLRVGGSTREIIEANDDKTYKFSLPHNAADLLITITLLRGRTELYANSRNRPPSVNHANYISKSYPGNLIYSNKADWKFNTGIWNVKVHAYEESEFFLETSAGINADNLKPRIPRMFYLQKNQFAQFELFSHQFEPGMTVFIRIIEGDITAVASQGRHWPTRENHDWKVSGHNQLLGLHIPAAEMKTDLYHIKLRLFNNVKGQSKFEVTLESYGSHAVLPEEQIVTIKTAEQSRNFDLIRPKEGNMPLYVRVDSCDSTSSPQIKLKNYTSEVINQGQSANDGYSSIINIDSVKATKNILQVDSNKLGNDQEQFSYSIVHGLLDVSPIFKKDPILKGEYTSTSFKLIFPRAFPAEEEHKSIEDYKVYVMSWKSTRDIVDNESNMRTPCSIEREGNPLEVRIADKDKDYIEANFFVEYKNIYTINVVATDSLGRKVNYEKAYILHGKLVHSLPSTNALLITFIVLPSIIGIFLSYCLLGSFIKYACGYKGSEIIPNISLWNYCLSPIKACALLVFTCGESTRSRENLDLEFDDDIEELEDQNEDDEMERPAEDNNIPDEQKPSSSGYGKV
eukprot:gb/GECH01012265.1/.p1 GENE.gb/GECH01012265.1/~~gb/GECH01012265.1/.p1  ORF type:complete len:1246 (+),score=222.43 gb/GECH01012265.1/:1-3738(+)